MHTEDEAREKWCPWSRVLEGTQGHLDNALAAINRPDGSFNCIASGCMAWRWAKATWIERKVYRKSDEHDDLLSARFPPSGASSLTFEFDGHLWMYELTSFDDDGEYDVIKRVDQTSTARGYCGLAGDPS